MVTCLSSKSLDKIYYLEFKFANRSPETDVSVKDMFINLHQGKTFLQLFK